MELTMCVFCENVYEGSIDVCPECNEYKGLVPGVEAVAYKGYCPECEHYNCHCEEYNLA